MGVSLNNGYHPSQTRLSLSVRIIVGILSTIVVLAIYTRLNAASDYARQKSCESVSYQEGDC